jgi:hypothetical protein
VFPAILFGRNVASRRRAGVNLRNETSPGEIAPQFTKGLSASPPTVSLATSSSARVVERAHAERNDVAARLPLRSIGIQSRVPTAIVYCEANFGAIDGKTANGLIRHSEKYEILSVIDSEQAGLDTGAVLDSKPNAIPICRDLSDALQQAGELPDYFIFGMAPATNPGPRLTCGRSVVALPRSPARA